MSSLFSLSYSNVECFVAIDLLNVTPPWVCPTLYPSVALSASTWANLIPPRNEILPSGPILLGADEIGNRYLFGFINNSLSFNSTSTLTPPMVDVIEACAPNLLKPPTSSILSFILSRSLLPTTGIDLIFLPTPLSGFNWLSGFISLYLKPPKCLSTWVGNRNEPAACRTPLSAPFSKSLVPALPKVERGLYILLSKVGLRAWKANCLAIKDIPLLDIINLNTLALSAKPTEVLVNRPTTPKAPERTPPIAPGTVSLKTSSQFEPGFLNMIGWVVLPLKGPLLAIVLKSPNDWTLLSPIPIGTLLNVSLPKPVNLNKSSIFLFLPYSFFRVIMFNPSLIVLLKASKRGSPSIILEASLGKNKDVCVPTNPSGLVDILSAFFLFGDENWDKKGLVIYDFLVLILHI